MAALTIGAFALVLASEVLGRFLFYATHIRIGI
jgi:DMSO reductase anchor subunit